MTGKSDGKPKFEFEHNGKWIRPDWSGLATMTATALESAPRPPGLLVDLNTWEPNPAKLEWFTLLKKIIEVHLRDNYWTVDKPCTIDIVNALRVEQCLTEILTAGYVTDDHRQFLPMGITAIARTASTANTIKAKGKRPNVDRRGALARAVSQERGKDKHATAGEVLDRLCGGDVVTECREGRVWYWNDEGKLTSVGLDRFETIFSEQKPSTG